MIQLDLTSTSAAMNGAQELGVSAKLSRAMDKAVYDCNVARNDGGYDHRDMPYMQESLDYALQFEAGTDGTLAALLMDGSCLFDKEILAKAVHSGFDAAEILAGARSADYLVGREQWQENPAAIIAAAAFIKAPLRLVCADMQTVCDSLAYRFKLCQNGSAVTAEILVSADERGLGALYYCLCTSADILALITE